MKRKTTARNHKSRNRRDYNKHVFENNNFKERIRFAKKSIVLIIIYRNLNLNFFSFNHFSRLYKKLADFSAEEKSARKESIVVKNNEATLKTRSSSDKIIHDLSVKRRKQSDLFAAITSESSNSKRKITSMNALKSRRNKERSRFKLNNIFLKADRC